MSKPSGLGLGFRAYGLGYRLWGLGFSIQGAAACPLLAGGGCMPHPPARLVFALPCAPQAPCRAPLVLREASQQHGHRAAAPRRVHETLSAPGGGHRYGPGKYGPGVCQGKHGAWVRRRFLKFPRCVPWAHFPRKLGAGRGQSPAPSAFAIRAQPRYDARAAIHAARRARHATT